MNTIGIVATALVAGAFLILLLLGLGLLLWKSFTLAQQMREAENQRAIVQVETAKTLDRYQTEIKALTEAHANRLKSDLESTKAAMNAIRAEIRSTWVEQTQALNALLSEHRKEMGEAIDKINAEALQSAAARTITAVKKLEDAVGILQTMYLEASAREREHYADDDYAEETTGPLRTPTSQYSVGTTARLDAEAEAVELAETEASTG